MQTETDDELEALLQFLYIAPIGLVQATADGEILMINPLCAQLLMPLSRDGGLDNLFSALEPVAPDLQARVRDFQPDHGMVCEALLLQVDAGQPGRASPKMLSLSLLKLDARRLMAVISDVTQSVQRERQLRQSEAWFNAIFVGVTEYALMSLDHAGRIESGNPSIERVTGFDGGAVAGQPYSLFYPEGGITPERLLDRLQEADLNGWSLDEGWRCRADGSRFWGSCLIAPLRVEESPLLPGCTAPQEPAYCLIVRDISDKRERHEALHRAVSCDHLTGLANRRAFFEAAELELQRWRRTPRALAVIVVDADHFKAVNDQHGHAGGDAVLRALAASFGAVFREVDVAARVGGEEFAVLLPGTSLAGAQAAAQRLCEHIRTLQVVHEGRTLRVTASAGVAAMEPGVDGLEALLRRADEALYAAKAAGRNRVQGWHAALATPPAPAGTPLPLASA